MRTTDFRMHANMHHSDHQNGRNRRVRRRPSAQLHAHHPSRPARASRRALQALLRIGKCKCGVGEVQRARAAEGSRWAERSRGFLGKAEACGHDPGRVRTAINRLSAYRVIGRAQRAQMTKRAENCVWEGAERQSQRGGQQSGLR